MPQRIKDAAIGIDSLPGPIFRTLDGDHHLIKLPFVGKSASRAEVQLIRKFKTELCNPFRDGLKRDLNAALGRKVFNVTKTERKPIIEPDGMRDDFGWKTVAVIVKLDTSRLA